MTSPASSQIKLRLKRSVIGCTAQQKAAVRALGFKKVGDVKQFKSTPVLKGQLSKVGHLFACEEGK